MTKDLKEKAIDIKGKLYVQVKDRIIFFNETYKDGYIQTRLLSTPKAQRVVVKAMIVPDQAKPKRYFTGLSQAVIGDGNVNKTSALENAETSAVGRALAMMGIGVLDSVASSDELSKAGVSEPKYVKTEPDMTDSYDKAMVNSKCKKCGAENVKNPNTGKWFCKEKCWTK